jgi:hypothetical protein
MDTKIYSHNEKKDLVRKIEKISTKAHYKQIFKIIKSSGAKITQNSNGVFFNMNELSNDILQKIEQYIDSILKNNNNLNIDMKYYNNVIMNTTTQSEGDVKNIIDYNNDSNSNE